MKLDKDKLQGHQAERQITRISSWKTLFRVGSRRKIFFLMVIKFSPSGN